LRVSQQLLLSSRTRSRSFATWTREHGRLRSEVDAIKLNKNVFSRYRIGCITTPKDFVVAGTATDKLYGVAEGLWEPDLVSPLLVALFLLPAECILVRRVGT